MRKLPSVLLGISLICLFFTGIVLADGNETTVSLDSPNSSQSYKPGDNVKITGKAPNIEQVTVLVRNSGGGIAYAAQPSVTNGVFSTEFQLNDDAVEGRYTIRIGAKELTAPVDFTFQVSKSSGGGGSGGSYPVPGAVTSTNGTATVPHNAGGTISLGSEATIGIPAGALQGTNKVEIKIEKITTPPAVPTGFKLAGSVYEFSVDGKKSYNFAKDITIKLNFDPNTLEVEEMPTIQYYDEAQNKWVNLGGTVSGNTVTIQVNHFTKYAVIVVKKTETEDEKLKDIAGHWAFDNIKKLIALGAINGYPDNSFKPNKTITRAEFATVLVKAFKIEKKGSKFFADTTAHWAKDYIATAAENGIVNGYNTATFGPDNPINREQMSLMIVKAAKLTSAAGEIQFSDCGKISPWAREAIATAIQNGIMKGYPDNTVRPQGSATRAEAVTVVVNVLNK
jgi:hypothetical protein